MNGTFLSQYRKKESGKVVFRYIVTGSPTDVEAYKALQGDKLVLDDDGKPLYFTIRFQGNKITLGLTSTGTLYVDTQVLDKAKSMIDNNPGILGDKIAE